MTESDTKTVQVMETFGGSFVKALAGAYRVADPNNRLLIRETWCIYWRRYERMGEALEEYEDREQEIEDAKFAPKEVLHVDEPMPLTRINPKTKTDGTQNNTA